MTHSISRRRLLAGGLGLAGSGALAPRALAALDAPSTHPRTAGPATATPTVVDPPALAALEARHHARLGVHAVNHRTGATVAHRADERFAFCSAYKALLVAEVLARGPALDRVVHYPASALVAYSPVTTALQPTGMTVAGLCAAALAYSDNTAANVLFGLTGGPHALTRYLRTLGDRTTQCDSREPRVNTAVPGALRDTTTPAALRDDLARLLLDDALDGYDRARLRFWMEGDQVNIERFRAGLPASWTIADKTGTGDYGVANDAGVAWTSRATPLSIAVLSTKSERTAVPDDALVADAARIVAATLAGDELR